MALGKSHMGRGKECGGGNRISMGHISFRGIPRTGKMDKYAYMNPAARQATMSEDFWRDRIRSLLDEYVVILDTETTGINSDARIIELTVIDLEGNVLFSSLFNTGEPLPEKIPELTGITDAMLEGQPAFMEKAEEIRDLLQGRTIIAWNASFDRQRLWEEFARIGMPVYTGEWRDAMELYAYASGRQKKWCKLIVAKQEMGIGESQEHRATADCLDTLAVLKAVVKANEEKDLFSSCGMEGEV